MSNLVFSRHTRDGHLRKVGQVFGHHIVRRDNSPLDDTETGEALQTDATRTEDALEFQMTWFHKVVWILHDMISGAAPVVSCSLDPNDHFHRDVYIIFL